MMLKHWLAPERGGGGGGSVVCVAISFALEIGLQEVVIEMTPNPSLVISALTLVAWLPLATLLRTLDS